MAFPSTIALVDDDREYCQYLAEYMRQLGAHVDAFVDSRDLLASERPYSYDFYIVDLMLPGIDGVNVIHTLRRRTNAGILVVSGRQDPQAFKEIVDASSDMYLAKPVQFDQVALAVTAVHRRAVASAPASAGSWCLDRRASQLVAPDETRIDLSAADLAVMECFVEAKGSVVSRDRLRLRLGREATSEGGADGLNAAIFRLRRRIERVTPLVVPLQSRSGVGYVFRAPIISV